eukprot:SAG31_NODE_36635_length_311_cov_1.212264_1_plen_36_part_10
MKTTPKITLAIRRCFSDRSALMMCRQMAALLDSTTK